MQICIIICKNKQIGRKKKHTHTEQNKHKQLLILNFQSEIYAVSMCTEALCAHKHNLMINELARGIID